MKPTYEDYLDLCEERDYEPLTQDRWQKENEEAEAESAATTWEIDNANNGHGS